jgi:hypothetical protein
MNFFDYFKDCQAFSHRYQQEPQDTPETIEIFRMLDVSVFLISLHFKFYPYFCL